MFELGNDRTWHAPADVDDILPIHADDELYPEGIASTTGLFSKEFIKHSWEADAPSHYLTADGLVLLYTRWDGRNFEPGGGNVHVLVVECFKEINPTMGELTFSERRFSGAFSPLFDEPVTDENRNSFVRAMDDIRDICKPYEALAWHRLGWQISEQMPVTSYISDNAARTVLELIKGGIDFDHAAALVTAGANTPDMLLNAIEHDLDTEIARRIF